MMEDFAEALVVAGRRSRSWLKGQWAAVYDAPSADKPTAVGAVLLKDPRPSPQLLNRLHTCLLVLCVVLPLGL